MATVSQELRTPLSSVMGSLESARGVLRQPAQARRFIDMGLRNGSQLASLIKSVLDLERSRPAYTASSSPRRGQATCSPARGGKPDLRHAPVGDPAHRAGTRRGVRLDRPRARPADPHQPISNAVKFSSEGEDVALSCEPQSDRVRLYVSDHGSGIPEDARDRIFQRFGQAATRSTRACPAAAWGCPSARRSPPAWEAISAFAPSPGKARCSGWICRAPWGLLLRPELRRTPNRSLHRKGARREGAKGAQRNSLSPRRRGLGVE